MADITWHALRFRTLTKIKKKENKRTKLNYDVADGLLNFWIPSFDVERISLSSVSHAESSYPLPYLLFKYSQEKSTGRGPFEPNTSFYVYLSSKPRDLASIELYQFKGEGGGGRILRL